MFSRFRFGRKKTEVQDQAMGPLQLATHFGATPRRGHMLPGRDGTVGILPATAQGVATGSCNRPAIGPIARAGRVVVGLQPPRHLLPVCVRPPVRTQNVVRLDIKRWLKWLICTVFHCTYSDSERQRSPASAAAGTSISKPNRAAWRILSCILCHKQQRSNGGVARSSHFCCH